MNKDNETQKKERANLTEPPAKPWKNQACTAPASGAEERTEERRKRGESGGMR